MLGSLKKMSENGDDSLTLREWRLFGGHFRKEEDDESIWQPESI